MSAAKRCTSISCGAKNKLGHKDLYPAAEAELRGMLAPHELCAVEPADAAVSLVVPDTLRL